MRAFLSSLILIAVTSTAPAHADRVDDLGGALASDPSFKVRVQAALTLGRIADVRGVPALIAALRDPSDLVRGMAVQSLALIGDMRGLGPVRALRNDPSPYVRDNVEKVLPAWEATSKKVPAEDAPLPPLVRTPLPPPPRGARFFLTTNLAVKGAPPGYTERLTDLSLRALAKVPKVAVTLPGPAAGSALPTARDLARLKLGGFTIQGTLTVSLSKVPLQLDCAWSGVLATFPARAIQATLIATLAVPGAKHLQQGNAIGQCIDAVAGIISDETRKFLKVGK